MLLTLLKLLLTLLLRCFARLDKQAALTCDYLHI